jgi:hypothetical protein
MGLSLALGMFKLAIASRPASVSPYKVSSTNSGLLDLVESTAQKKLAARKTCRDVYIRC